MNPAADYGTPAKPPKPKEPILNQDNKWALIVGIIVVAVLALIIAPFTIYVVTIVPTQHQQRQELMLECLAHHTVKSCDQLTGKAAVE